AGLMVQVSCLLTYPLHPCLKPSKILKTSIRSYLPCWTIRYIEGCLRTQIIPKKSCSAIQTHQKMAASSPLHGSFIARSKPLTVLLLNMASKHACSMGAVALSVVAVAQRIMQLPLSPQGRCMEKLKSLSRVKSFMPNMPTPILLYLSLPWASLVRSKRAQQDLWCNRLNYQIMKHSLHV